MIKKQKKNKKLKGKAKIYTVYLMNKDVKFIDFLVDNGYFLSRSEAVRIAVHEFTKMFIELHEKIKKFKPIKNPMEKIELSPDGWKILGPTHIVKNNQNG